MEMAATVFVPLAKQMEHDMHQQTFLSWQVIAFPWPKIVEILAEYHSDICAQDPYGFQVERLFNRERNKMKKQRGKGIS